MSGPLLRQGVETERECAKNVTGVALWRGSNPNARGSKPNAGSISCGRRRIVALSLAKKWFDIILPSRFYVYVTGGALWEGRTRMRGSTPNAWSISGGRRCTLDDMLCCLPVWLCDLQRNGSIYLLCGRVIVERVDTACWGVDAGCVVHVSWQAQHFPTPVPPQSKPKGVCGCYSAVSKLQAFPHPSPHPKPQSHPSPHPKPQSLKVCVGATVLCLSFKPSPTPVPTLNPSPTLV